jgi:hypothetical protein
MLTAVQAAMLSEHRDRWAALRLSASPGDRSAAETGIELAYRAAGLRPPERIEWSRGPLELASAWEHAVAEVQPGSNVRAALLGHVRERTEAAIRRRLPTAIWGKVIAGVRTSEAEAVTTAADRAIIAAARQRRAPVRVRIGRVLRSIKRLQWPARGMPPFERAGFGPSSLDWVAAMEIAHTAFGMERETEPLRGHWILAANTGWILPHENVCWLSDRPVGLAHDVAGRLHSATGPALAFGDGWTVHAWKGIQVRARLIEQPDTITIAAIDREPDIFVRRCMIEIMGVQRFLTLGGASKVAQDATGTLWRKTWFAGDAWAAVEVVNGTPEPDGTYRHYVLQVPPEMPTARAAVAWTYGMNEHQYARLTLRT